MIRARREIHTDAAAIDLPGWADAHAALALGSADVAAGPAIAGIRPDVDALPAALGQGCTVRRTTPVHAQRRLRRAGVVTGATMGRVGSDQHTASAAVDLPGVAERFAHAGIASVLE